MHNLHEYVWHSSIHSCPKSIIFPHQLLQTKLAKPGESYLYLNSIFQSLKGLLLTISMIRGEITSGSISWICSTCLLYSSVIVLSSVRQATTLGYNKLQAQERRFIGERFPFVSGVAAALTVSRAPFSDSRSTFSEWAPGFREARQLRCVAAPPGDLGD